MPDLETCVHLACLLESTARKAGNVHPGRSFKHLDYEDFVRSAEAVAPILPLAGKLGVGSTVLECVRATREVCPHNTNLGIVLLLAPLCAVPLEMELSSGIGGVLNSLTAGDAEAVYEAIRLAAPRGLGEAERQDVSQQPTQTLLEVMSMAADRDSIAEQYATAFRRVLASGGMLPPGSAFAAHWETAVIRLQLEMMASQPDTDIARKCGSETAGQSAVLARKVLDSLWPQSVAGTRLFREFDQWLRDPDSQRNPGTTADLVTASLFVALRERRIAPPPSESLIAHAAWITQSHDQAVFALS